MPVLTAFNTLLKICSKQTTHRADDRDRDITKIYTLFNPLHGYGLIKLMVFSV